LKYFFGGTVLMDIQGVPLKRALFVRGLSNSVHGLGGGLLADRKPARGREKVYIIVR
jgi:hypothetical protein